MTPHNSQNVYFGVGHGPVSHVKRSGLKTVPSEESGRMKINEDESIFWQREHEGYCCSGNWPSGQKAFCNGAQERCVLHLGPQEQQPMRGRRKKKIWLPSGRRKKWRSGYK